MEQHSGSLLSEIPLESFKVVRENLKKELKADELKHNTNLYSFNVVIWKKDGMVEICLDIGILNS